MSVWVIADLHLSFGKDVPKPMDRFGSRWENHAEKIARRWNAVVRPGDTVVMPGDFSWADTLSEAEADFRFLDALPGKKLLGKGNHDYWWTGVTKRKAFLAERGFSTVWRVQGDGSSKSGSRRPSKRTTASWCGGRRSG